jgi:hypothetical protein
MNNDHAYKCSLNLTGTQVVQYVLCRSRTKTDTTDSTHEQLAPERSDVYRWYKFVSKHFLRFEAFTANKCTKTLSATSRIDFELKTNVSCFGDLMMETEQVSDTLFLSQLLGR